MKQGKYESNEAFAARKMVDPLANALGKLDPHETKYLPRQEAWQTEEGWNHVTDEIVVLEQAIQSALEEAYDTGLQQGKWDALNDIDRDLDTLHEEIEDAIGTFTFNFNQLKEGT